MTDWNYDMDAARRDGTVVLITDGKVTCAGVFAPAIHGPGWDWAFVDDYKELISGCCDREETARVACNAFMNGAVIAWMPLPSPPKGQSDE